MKKIFIKAINPGYTVDGKTNVGEFIELSRPASDAPFSLTNLILGYTNSSGNAVELFAFPENSWMDGESLLLRLASSPNSELADATYSKTLALSAGPLQLILNGEVIDEVCWTGKNGCEKAFNSSKPTTLVRDLETDTFSHQENYEPTFSPKQPVASPEPALMQKCQGLQFSEIFTFYETDQSEQFIEFFNSTTAEINLDDCFIKYKNNTYPLFGSVSPESYFIYQPTAFSLTKSPTSSNLIELFDVDDSLIDFLTYGPQRKSTSFAKISANDQPVWRQTYAITKGSANIFQEFKSCPEGKEINEKTGNCVKIAETKEKTCAEGYFLNPETNRCRKVRENDGAENSLEVVENYVTTEESFIAIWVVLALLIFALIYALIQFREELKKLFCKVFRLFHKEPRRVPDRH